MNFYYLSIHLHKKTGFFHFDWGDKISFIGGQNDTIGGLENNIEELELRKKNNLPPYERFISLILSSSNEKILNVEATKLKNIISKSINEKIIYSKLWMCYELFR